jgi:hypothetical protein
LKRTGKGRIVRETAINFKERRKNIVVDKNAKAYYNSNTMKAMGEKP